MSSSSSAIVKSSLAAKDPNVGGGNLGKSTRGWNNLPNNIIHCKILDHVIKDAEMTSSLEETWVSKVGSAETAVAIARRRELCDTRLVSRGWKSGIDSHAFWPKYTLILDQSKSHGSTVADMRSSRITPSTPTFPSLFHRARALTLDICLPCRLNYPHRMGFYPADKRSFAWSNKLGFIPTCSRHRGNYCSCCLRQDGMIRNHNSGYRVVVSNCVGDVDENGNVYRYPVTCNDCREASLTAHIENELKVCARGGKVTGSVHDILETPCAQEYFQVAPFNAKETAKLAVRDAWISYQTVFDDLEDTVKELQIEENILKSEFLLSGKRSSKRTNQKRVRLIEHLFNEPAGDIVPYMNRAFADVADRFDDWAEDDEEFDDEGDGEELIVEGLGDVRPFWIQLAQDAALYRWARDRIRAGYWVYPSDEVEAIVRPELATFSGRDTIVSSARLPIGILPYPRNPYIVNNLKFDVFKPDDESTFLPPRSILKVLDNTYAHLMFNTIRKPFWNRIMHHISSGYENEELTSRRPSTWQALDFLGTEEGWSNLLPYRAPISFPISAPVWSTPKDGSPKVEAVPAPSHEMEEHRHGNGFIVDVEVEGDSVMTVDEDVESDNKEEGSEDIAEEEEKVESRTTSQGPIVEDSEEDRSIMDRTTPPVETDPGSAFHTPADKIIGQEYYYTQEQESNEINASGKRKTPPTATMSINDRDENENGNDGTTRPTKRRSSNSSHVDPHIDSNDNEVDKEQVEKLPRKSSEESLTSSDPMPSTPLNLETAPPVKNAFELIEEKKRIRAAAEPRVPKYYIPHIPAPEMKLGRETELLLEKYYDSVLEPWICCRCRICMRTPGFRHYEMD